MPQTVCSSWSLHWCLIFFLPQHDCQPFHTNCCFCHFSFQLIIASKFTWMHLIWKKKLCYHKQLRRLKAPGIFCTWIPRGVVLEFFKVRRISSFLKSRIMTSVSYTLLRPLFPIFWLLAGVMGMSGEIHFQQVQSLLESLAVSPWSALLPAV